MAAPPDRPLVSVDDYLNSSYPDVDREYLDGILLEKRMPPPATARCI